MQLLIFVVCTLFVMICYLAFIVQIKLQASDRRIDNEFTREAKALIKLYKSDMDSTKKFKAVGEQLVKLEVAYDRLEGVTDNSLDNSQILQFQKYHDIKKASSFK